MNAVAGAAVCFKGLTCVSNNGRVMTLDRKQLRICIELFTEGRWLGESGATEEQKRENCEYLHEV